MTEAPASEKYNTKEKPERREKMKVDGVGSEVISDEDLENFTESFGVCKWFDVNKGYGFIIPDNKEKTQKDVFVYQETIQMPGFRSLKKGEKVRFWYKNSNQGLEAVRVSGPSGESCLGTPKKANRRKKPERCFNCGEIGHHAKECSCPPMPKKCHHCRSVEHLVADCPEKRNVAADSNQNGLPVTSSGHSSSYQTSNSS